MVASSCNRNAWYISAPTQNTQLTGGLGKTYGVTDYRSGWRKNAGNCALEFAHDDVSPCQVWLQKDEVSEDYHLNKTRAHEQTDKHFKMCTPAPKVITGGIKKN